MTIGGLTRVRILSVDRGAVTVHCIDDPAAIVRLRDSYVHLFESHPHAHIATSFAYLLANAMVRRRADAWRCFAVFSGSELLGALFGYRTSRSVLGASLPAFKVGTEFVSDPLVKYEHGREIMTLLVDAMLSDQSDCVTFDFDRLTPSSFDVLRDCLHHTYRSIRGWAPYGVRISTALPPEAFLSRMGRKRRQELGRRHRRLSDRYTVEFSLENSRSKELNSDRFEQFLELEDSGWKGRGETSILRRPGNEDYFRTIVDTAASAGQMNWCILRADGRPIAINFCLQAHGELWMPKVAYDEDFAPYGPGMMATHLLLLTLCDDHSISSLNNIGGAPWLEPWRPSRLQHRSLTLFAETPTAIALFLGVKARDVSYRALFRRDRRATNRDQPYL
jgi:hypothetical protein